MKRTLRPEPEKLFGATGRAVTDLKPQGRVLVQGFEYGAHTAGVFYAAGTEVVVVDVDQLGLVVRVPRDGEALNALVGIKQKKLTPRWRWWERADPSDPDRLTLLIASVWWFMLALTVLGLGAGCWVWFLRDLLRD